MTVLHVVGMGFNFIRAILGMVSKPQLRKLHKWPFNVKNVLVQQGLAGNQKDNEATNHKFEIESSL